MNNTFKLWEIVLFIFILSLKVVETGPFKSSGLYPVGDQNRAIGPLQIHKPYWEDAKRSNKYLGGSYANAEEFNYSVEVTASYLKRYGNGVPSDMARIHNGGPSGHKKEATIKYSQKVMAIFQGWTANELATNKKDD